MRLTKQASYIFSKGGVFYFSRRIPKDLRAHYKRARIVLCLHTRSSSAARTRAVSLAAKLEEDWLTLRWRSTSDPFSRFLHETTAVVLETSGAPHSSEAKELYLQAKSDGRGLAFVQSTNRAIGYLRELAGDRPVDTYTRQVANQLRDALASRGLTQASIRRNLSVVRAVVNFACREHGLPEVTAFASIYLGEEDASTATKRKPIPANLIRSVQSECKRLDDEARWLIALISDTGMRLSEAVALVREDVFLDDRHPHVRLKAHPWRRLKTRGSERIVPLAGAALWAARRAVASTNGSFLFPTYCNKKTCKANSASAALNKWLGPRVTGGYVLHSFRHSMRDRLRAVECPRDIIDRIGGWAVSGVGETYGSGHPVAILHKWMSKAVGASDAR